MFFVYKVHYMIPVHSVFDFKLTRILKLCRFIPWLTALVIRVNASHQTSQPWTVHPLSPSFLFSASLLPVTYSVISSILRLWSTNTKFWLVTLGNIYLQDLPKAGRSVISEPLIIDLEENLPIEPRRVVVSYNPNSWKIKAGRSGSQVRPQLYSKPAWTTRDIISKIDEMTE